MDDNLMDDLLRRLTTLIVKLDERDDRMTTMLERHDAMIEELRAFNREQIRINQRLEQLMTAVFRERPNGRTP
jgi:hypothetical protein